MAVIIQAICIALHAFYASPEATVAQEPRAVNKLRESDIRWKMEKKYEKINDGGILQGLFGGTGWSRYLNKSTKLHRSVCAVVGRDRTSEENKDGWSWKCSSCVAMTHNSRLIQS